MHQKGFTLVELMIVVAVVAILAAVSIPAYRDFMVRSRLNNVLGEMSACKLIAVAFYEENAGWTDDNGINVSALNLCDRPQGTEHVQPAGLSIGPTGIISASIRNLGGGIADGTVVTMRPRFNGLNLTGWTCGDAGDGTNLEPRFRPATCQG